LRIGEGIYGTGTDARTRENGNFFTAVLSREPGENRFSQRMMGRASTLHLDDPRRSIAEIRRFIFDFDPAAQVCSVGGETARVGVLPEGGETRKRWLIANSAIQRRSENARGVPITHRPSVRATTMPARAASNP
jgi:hypothetical protein